MTVEVTLAISIIAVIFSGIGVFSSMKFNNKKQDNEQTTQLTTVIVKLDVIGSDVKEVKADLRDVKAEMRNHGERIVKLEQQVEALQKATHTPESTD